ncbi:hypothetical protein [Pelagibius sp. Alg239-R121]|uniref:hypothetical protein n=1 Tax=Pelagibius sp. Alg239-R121 TaxID=2993448 RepID=UPI0024A67CA3|nr:hypothetical protein [Pelagibius sp. Alg239-R121]
MGDNLVVAFGFDYAEIGFLIVLFNAGYVVYLAFGPKMLVAMGASVLGTGPMIPWFLG